MIADSLAQLLYAGFWDRRLHLYSADCLSVLQDIDSETIDSLVTDPPAGIAFMGKDWDHHKGGRDQWIAWMTDVMKECLRVMKPGAHGLVWAIPRTSHWTATALENAGFEVRDVVTHLFGSGFPKSMCVSKAIDKAAGAKREVVGTKLKSDIRGSTINGEWIGLNKPDKPRIEVNYTAPATDAAKQWQGFGTALKPASEHWILIRKPLSERTVAANVLKHGTGGLNIDGCRIQTVGDKELNWTPQRQRADSAIFGSGEVEHQQSMFNPQGRFPANLLLSHNPDCELECSEGCAVRELDRQSGVSKSTPQARNNKPSPNLSMSGANAGHVSFGHADTGGASRFFYCAKASKRDKGESNTHPTVKNTKLMEYLIKLVTPPGGVVLDPFMGSGSTGVSALRTGFKFIGIEEQTEYFKIAKKRLLVK